MNSALVVNYTGAWRDPVCDGLPLGNGYRTYLPDLMRFNAPDALSPFGEGGINPYVYCSGDPINFADPSGQFRISWQGGLGIFAALLGIGLAIFTEGSSLAIVGAVLGGASAVTGIAADNTEGTAHDVLTGLSIASGVAGGIADVADVARSAISAMRLSSGIGQGMTAVEFSAAAQTVWIRIRRGSAASLLPADAARAMGEAPDAAIVEAQIHAASGVSRADAETAEAAGAPSSRSSLPEIGAQPGTAAQEDSYPHGGRTGSNWISYPIEDMPGYSRFRGHYYEGFRHLEATVADADLDDFTRIFGDQRSITDELHAYRDYMKNSHVPWERKKVFENFKRARMRDFTLNMEKQSLFERMERR